MERRGHDPVQFLVREVLLLRFRMFGLMTEKRVGGDDAVSDGLLDHGLQTYREIYDSSRSQATFGTQVQVIFLDKGKVQRCKRDVRYFVLRPDEVLQVAVCVPVARETFGRAVLSSTYKCNFLGADNKQ